MYRTEERPPERPERPRRITDKASKAILELDNGVTSRIAFPCFYAYREDGKPFPCRRIPPAWWDHRGWPEPRHPDHSWQPRRIEGLMIEPIHLADEGYTDAKFLVEEYGKPEGFGATAWIDDSIVRVTLTAECIDAQEGKLEFPFSIFLEGSFEHDGESYRARDLLTSGTVRIRQNVGIEDIPHYGG